ncbi:MAG: photosynthetic reaction center subunit H, partial [Pseudomonadota bacterium]
PNQGPFPVPKPKTWKLPNGRGERSVPDLQRENRELALVKTAESEGFPFEPTGDPMIDGVGPASWAPRRDLPELTAHGHNKLVPMRNLPGFTVSWGKDLRGMTVVSGDRKKVGTVSDMWIDEGEQLVRYVELDLGEHGKRLAPMTLCKLRGVVMVIKSLHADQFPGIPRTKEPDVVTMLEEEKISAWYCGGVLYAGRRAEPIL